MKAPTLHCARQVSRRIHLYLVERRDGKRFLRESPRILDDVQAEAEYGRPVLRFSRCSEELQRQYRLLDRMRAAAMEIWERIAEEAAAGHVTDLVRRAILDGPKCSISVDRLEAIAGTRPEDPPGALAVWSDAAFHAYCEMCLGAVRGGARLLEVATEEARWEDVRCVG